MRLLHTTSLQVIEWTGSDTPPYAILSHTWITNQEVSLQDFQALSQSKWSIRDAQAASAIKSRSGYAKIITSAALAASHGLEYIWIDTCCIDKTSSAELSEAINSMYCWYQKASICYAYLADIQKDYQGESGDEFYNTCRISRWFQRGWTLQELIAPEDIMFYDAQWTLLGSKEHDNGIQHALSLITGIDVRVLDGSLQPSEISVANRMKWASNRQTTREEDKAYCLMGIFDVNMPLLYGEGTRAFIRLQEEIISTSDDQTIFAWSLPASLDSSRQQNAQLHGLLAQSPEHFSNVEHYRPLAPALTRKTEPWTVSNQGLRVTLLLRQTGLSNTKEYDDYYAILECTTRSKNESYWSPAIRLRRLYGDQFARVDCHLTTAMLTPSFDAEDEQDTLETIFVKRIPQYALPDFLMSFRNIQQSDNDTNSYCVHDVWPAKHWDADSATLKTSPSGDSQLVGLFRFQAPNQQYKDIDMALCLGSGRKGAVRPLFRPSSGTLRQAFKSASMYVSREAGIQQQNKFLIETKGTWSESQHGLQVKFSIQERKLHGRLYYYIEGTTMDSDEQLGDGDISILAGTALGSWQAGNYSQIPARQVPSISINTSHVSLSVDISDSDMQKASPLDKLATFDTANSGTPISSSRSLTFMGNDDGESQSPIMSARYSWAGESLPYAHELQSIMEEKFDGNTAEGSGNVKESKPEPTFRDWFASVS